MWDVGTQAHLNIWQKNFRAEKWIADEFPMSREFPGRNSAMYLVRSSPIFLPNNFSANLRPSAQTAEQWLKIPVKFAATVQLRMMCSQANRQSDRVIHPRHPRFIINHRLHREHR